ncbi:hypothetical protein N027_02395 [Pseudomonas syringae USA007]|jgi:hypothetical protein|uniref:Uncharacterized protein n=1 Tax=Pseudomonas syringae USA007 TaxID=1357288 RepID=A0AAU8MA50_PSESX|nr:hypothetical protein [Pseudomonas syringae]MCR8720041.1 hypothetical protein [Pseudomonas syringae]
MAALRRNFVFLSFPVALGVLGLSIRGGSENPLQPSDTYGLPPVAIYFVVLVGFGALSFLLAAAGRLLECFTSSVGRMGRVIRLVLFAPMLLSTCLATLVSAGYALDSLSGIFACLLSLISTLGAYSLFSKNKNLG